jgi:hypothetical protein
MRGAVGLSKFLLFMTMRMKITEQIRSTWQMSKAVGQFLLFMISWMMITRHVNSAGLLRGVLGLIDSQMSRVLLQMNLSVLGLLKGNPGDVHLCMPMLSLDSRELEHCGILAILLTVSRSCVRTGLLSVQVLWGSRHIFTTIEGKIEALHLLLMGISSPGGLPPRKPLPYLAMVTKLHPRKPIMSVRHGKCWKWQNLLVEGRNVTSLPP